ncbi:hypothetical protein EJ03DRAFT_327176 [Teratosphaeria nubilosa]|uniref:Uncharacterized protein n=1 Tax=Teratosphaeria nubilosa TaxID=161662 RepID=A0A6G1L9G2_9PEZI|nr:hypothetical protein EJ03DRAFT_327176 [Teratosphaeria nubilosa]
MEAEKLKKKLNGSLLKGAKIRIEEAKPERKRKGGDGEAGNDEKVTKKVKKEKMRKEQGVLSGREIDEGRHVKRGWTEGKDEKRGSKRKVERQDAAGIEEKKMKFRAVVPPNVGTVEKEKVGSKSKEKREKKGKRMAVVQEGKKAQKLPASGMGVKGKAAVTFEEGKGWLDEEGNVIEAAPVVKRPKRAKAVENVVDSAVEAAEESSSEESSVLSESSAVSSDEEESDAEPPAAPVAEISTPPPGFLSQPGDNPSQAKDVHPLEALFKRPAHKNNPDPASKPKPQPINTSFTFFNSGAADEDLNLDLNPGSSTLPPQTPHTKQDLEFRSVRSAAPTPDTAAVGRKFSFPFAGGGGLDDEGGEGEEVEVEERDAEGGAVREEESEFRKWFFEHRGDLNRGWKRRRREERKVRRQRENRRLGRRVV